jgi:hypothetical protein
MRKYLMMAAAAAAVLAVPFASASAQSGDGLNRWVRINNVSGGHTVVTLYAVPSSFGAGRISSPDLIPAVTIHPGQSYAVNIDDGRGTCLYDLRATSQTPGREWIVRNFNVCAHSNWNLGS